MKSKDAGSGDKLLSVLEEKRKWFVSCAIFRCTYTCLFSSMMPFIKLPVTPTEIYASFTLQTLREELKNIDENLLTHRPVLRPRQ